MQMPTRIQIKTLLGSRRGVWLILLTSGVLLLPALATGFVLDDRNYGHVAEVMARIEASVAADASDALDLREWVLLIRCTKPYQACRY